MVGTIHSDLGGAVLGLPSCIENTGVYRLPEGVEHLVPLPFSGWEEQVVGECGPWSEYPGLCVCLAVEECVQDGNNMLIPIAVGGALAGLVLIVLIAYLIGRKRSHAGYQTI